MAHFAEIDENNVVVQVIVAEQDFIDTLEGTWVQTSYNTYGGKHYNQEGNIDGDGLRKNYAGIGYIYNAQLDAFIPKQPFDSWSLNTETCLWEPPVIRPVDLTDPNGNLLGNFYWNETSYFESGDGWMFEPNCADYVEEHS